MPDQSDATILNETLARYFKNPAWRNAYVTVEQSDALSDLWRSFERGFGRSVVPVVTTAGRFDVFNGFRIPQNPGVLYVNARANRNPIAIAGHELYEDLAATRKDLHAWFVEKAQPYIRNLPEYQRRLNSLLQAGEKLQDSNDATRELLADFTGDALTDPAFLQQLADDNPGKFQQLLQAIRQWLNKVIARLQGNRSEEFITDVKALRKYLALALKAHSEGKDIAEISPPKFSLGNNGEFDASNPDIRFQRANDAAQGGSIEGAPEWVKEQPADMQETLRKAGAWRPQQTLQDRIADWTKDWQKKLASMRPRHHTAENGHRWRPRLF